MLVQNVLDFFPARGKFCASDGTKLVEAKELSVAAKETKPAEREEPPSNADMPKAHAASVNVPGAAVAGESAQRAEEYIHPALQGAGRAELIGVTLNDKYRLESVIAEGGMATLYRAHQLGIDRTVAVKVMLPNVAPSATAIQRFEQECILAARLNHPNIVSVYDVGFVSPERPYLVMEFIDGRSLAQELVDKGAPPLTVAAQVLIQVLKGLEEAHSMGIIHRDLKPDNILLQRKSNRSDWVKIVDFGIANLTESPKRLTKWGAFIGTPVYMAPEQFKGKPLDVRIDLYSLGVVMFETLTGDVPFDGAGPEVIMMKHLLEAAPKLAQVRPDAPECLQAVLDKSLAKDPEQRFQSAAEFRQALEDCLKEMGASS
jgi:serine/threonine-protein kinase